MRPIISKVVDIEQRRTEKAVIPAIERVSSDTVKRLRPYLEAKTPEAKQAAKTLLVSTLRASLESVKKRYGLTEEELEHFIDKADLKDVVVAACKDERDFWAQAVKGLEQ